MSASTENGGSHPTAEGPKRAPRAPPKAADKDKRTPQAPLTVSFAGDDAALHRQLVDLAARIAELQKARGGRRSRGLALAEPQRSTGGRGGALNPGGALASELAERPASSGA